MENLSIFIETCFCNHDEEKAVLVVGLARNVYRNQDRNGGKCLKPDKRIWNSFCSQTSIKRPSVTSGHPRLRGHNAC